MHIPWCLLPAAIEAQAWGTVYVRPGVTASAILLAHEEEHLAQQARDGRWLWLWRYCTSRRWRLVYEVGGYRVSVARGMSLAGAALLLCTRYWLGITEAQALAALQGEGEHA